MLATRNASAVRLFLYNHYGSGDAGTACNVTVRLDGAAVAAALLRCRYRDATDSVQTAVRPRRRAGPL